MIKKLNALMLVLVAVMVMAKLALKSSRKKSVRESGETFVCAQARNAEFAPTVHYFDLPGLSLVNPLTNRNGYLLDVMRAIFPRARFEGMSVPDLAEIGEEVKRGTDTLVMAPLMVPELLEKLGLVLAKTPLYNQDVVVYTLRPSEWNYTGVGSLRELKKLGMRAELARMPAMKGLVEKMGERLRIYKRGEAGYERFSQALLSGEVDGYLMQRQNSKLAATEDGGLTGDMTFNLRCSPPVGEVPVVPAVPNADPDRAKKLIEAYERGYREIEASGELRRIREYYGK